MKMIKRMRTVCGAFAVFSILSLAAFGGTTYYASPTGGGDGSSEGSPTTLAEAVAKASTEGAGAVVQLADGTYTQTAEIKIAADITVRGTSREGTIVTKDASKDFRLFTLNSAGAALKDLTVENGRIPGYGANILIETGGGLVENCVIRNGYGYNNGNGGSGIALKAGEVVGCVVTNNEFCSNNSYTHSCGAVFFCSCTKAAARRCVIARNFGRTTVMNAPSITAGIGVRDTNAKGVVIDSSTIAENSGCRSGGIFSGCAETVVTNCLFAGNVSRNVSSEYKDFCDGTKNLKIYDCFFDAGTTITGTDGQTGYVAFADDTYAPNFVSENIGKARDGSDIGAVQHGPVTEMTGYVDSPAAKAVIETPLTWTVYATDENGNVPEEVVWDFGDGETATGARVAHAFTTAGTYVPKATVTVGGLTQDFFAKPVTIGPDELFASPEDDLVDMVSAACPGATIYLAPGEYELKTIGKIPYGAVGDTALVLDKPVRIIGETGNPYDVALAVKRNKTRAIYLGDPGASVEGVLIQGGSVAGNYYYGGAVMLNGGTVSNCVMTGCTSTDNGSGGAAVGMYDGLVTHCVISNNTSTITQYNNNGGAVNMYGGTVRTCLICNNTGNNNANQYVNVGGVSMAGGTLESCTVAGNFGAGCGGVWVRKNTAKVLNCAIHDNSASTGTETDNQWRDNAGCFDTCASTVAISGGKSCVKGNLNVVSASLQDWHPAVGSCAVGAGAVQDWMTDAVDLDGNPMVVDGKTDIGCFQYQATYLTGFVNADVLEGVMPLTVVLTVAGECEDPITGYVWDFGDGTATERTTEPTITHVYEAVGEFCPSVKLEVASTGRSGVFPMVESITVGNAHFYVTAEENENSAFPWDSEENAATNLEQVIPYALNSSTITLLAGRHETSAQIDIVKGVTIESADGDPESTILTLRKGTKAHRLFTVNHAGARITGIALEGDGRQQDVNGSIAYVDSLGGTISNCVIRGGFQCNNGVCGAGICLGGGTLTHSVISNNIGASSMGYGHSGGALSIMGMNAVVDYCLVTSNRTWCGNRVISTQKLDDGTVRTNVTQAARNGGIVLMRGGTIRNCTITGNYAGKDGGTADNAGFAGISAFDGVNVIQNCLVANNTSEGDVDSPLRRVADANAVNAMSHCATDVDIGRAAQGCVWTNDMKFVDATNGDWRIRCNSVASKTADISVISATRDLVGEPTIYLRDKADIGCYTRADKPGIFIFVR